MPKVTDTRKQRAAELLDRVQRGPVMAMPSEKLNQKEISRHYKIWSESWIISELIDLIPELRKQKELTNGK